MMNLHCTLTLLGGMALVSCAAPKAVVIEVPPVPKKVVKVPPVINQAPLPKPVVNEGLRMPDMLALPTENEFRSSNSAGSRAGNEAGAVIARPPKPTSPSSEP